MDIKQIISDYNEQLEQSCEIDFISEQEKQYVRAFLQRVPKLNADDLFMDFLFTYFAVSSGSGNMGLYGYIMIQELDEPPISEQDFLGFSGYLNEWDKKSVSTTFFWDLTGIRKKGVYCRHFIRFEQKVIEESNIYFFCESFVELLDIIFRWEIDNTEFEIIHQYVKQKYADSGAKIL